MHAKGLAHRDLAPGKIYVTADGDVAFSQTDLRKADSAAEAAQNVEKLGAILSELRPRPRYWLLVPIAAAVAAITWLAHRGLSARRRRCSANSRSSRSAAASRLNRQSRPTGRRSRSSAARAGRATSISSGSAARKRSTSRKIPKATTHIPRSRPPPGCVIIASRPTRLNPCPLGPTVVATK